MTPLLRKMLLLILFISTSLIYFSHKLSAHHLTVRRLTDEHDHDYYMDSLNEFPPLLFTHEELKNWGWTLCFIGMIYCIIGIAIVCDDYFVPAVELIADRFEISEDIAGATWLAIGTSSPELFTCFIGTFVAQSDVGFGTIVGSAIFNVGLILGSCAIFSDGDLKIAWWSFTRDMLYLLLALGALALFFGGISRNEIYWWESLTMLLLYIVYVFIMKYNEEIKQWFFDKYIYTGDKEREKQLLSKQNDYGTSTYTRIDQTSVRSTIPTTDVLLPFTPFDTGKITPSFEPSEHYLLNSEQELQDLSPTKSVHYIRNDQTQIYQMLHKETMTKDTKDQNNMVQELSVTENGNNNDRRHHKPTLTAVSIKGTGGGDYFIRELSHTQHKGKGMDLSFPSQGIWKRIWYIIQIPLKLPINFTLIDVTKKSNESKWPWTFMICIIWLGGLSYLMVWWCVAVGYAWLIPQEIMGLVFLAFGTSLPELITCVIVAKIGKADMAIAGAIASNILNILVGLPLPWLSMSIISNIGGGGDGDLKINVKAQGLLMSILVLIVMMAAISILIVINKWILTHCIGWSMIALYIVFVVQDLVRYYWLDIDI